jgi:hypothetical protein
VNTLTDDEVLPGLGILRHDGAQVHAYPPGGTVHDWAGSFNDRDEAVAYLQHLAERTAR